MDSNCWLGVGRLTKDAELTQTKKGAPMSKFRMAINDRRNDKTLFINVRCFNRMAEAFHPQLIKGREVSVQGKLDINDYVDENNNRRNSVCVMADEISLGLSPTSITRSSETVVETES